MRVRITIWFATAAGLFFVGTTAFANRLSIKDSLTNRKALDRCLISQLWLNDTQWQQSENQLTEQTDAESRRKYLALLQGQRFIAPLPKSAAQVDFQFTGPVTVIINVQTSSGQKHSYQGHFDISSRSSSTDFTFALVQISYNRDGVEHKAQYGIRYSPYEQFLPQDLRSVELLLRPPADDEFLPAALILKPVK